MSRTFKDFALYGIYFYAITLYKEKEALDCALFDLLEAMKRDYFNESLFYELFTDLKGFNLYNVQYKKNELGLSFFDGEILDKSELEKNYENYLLNYKPIHKNSLKRIKTSENVFATNNKLVGNKKNVWEAQAKVITLDSNKKLLHALVNLLCFVEENKDIFYFQSIPLETIFSDKIFYYNSELAHLHKESQLIFRRRKL